MVCACSGSNKKYARRRLRGGFSLKKMVDNAGKKLKQGARKGLRATKRLGKKTKRDASKIKRKM